MNHIDQLKQIRSDAVARMRASDDYKLAARLGSLIVELGGTVDDHLSLTKSHLGSSSQAYAAKDSRSSAIRPVETSKPVAATAAALELNTDDMAAELVAGMEDDLKSDKSTDKAGFDLKAASEK